jgi:hypothetical protein
MSSLGSKVNHNLCKIYVVQVHHKWRRIFVVSLLDPHIILVVATPHNLIVYFALLTSSALSNGYFKVKYKMKILPNTLKEGRLILLYARQTSY